METELTDEEIAKLTPEQIVEIEENPKKAAEFRAQQDSTGTDKSEQAEQQGAANGADEAEAVVLNKSGKGIIPYEHHKQLRVENATLREQLQEQQRRMEELMQQRRDAQGDPEAERLADEAIEAQGKVIEEDMPELHSYFNAKMTRFERQLQALQKEREEAEKRQAEAIAEQVQEAKENNPYLIHWEANDPDAWREAETQDQLLRYSPEWANRSFADRFEEVVRRVQSILPSASKPNTPDRIEASAKAKLEAAPARKPTTLSDIHGGANPLSEREKLENLSPHDLTAKLLQIPARTAAAMRADLD